MIVLVLGGARSGKSDVAERMAAQRAGPVTYVATGVPGDPEMRARIEAHRARRPEEWTTLEPDPGAPVVRALTDARGTVLLDSLGTWVAGAPATEIDTADLVNALVARQGDTIVVSEEVGMGVHPSTEVGRRFRDALGELNRAVAEVADDVFLVVAGRTLRLSDVTGA